MPISMNRVPDMVVALRRLCLLSARRLRLSGSFRRRALLLCGLFVLLRRHIRTYREQKKKNRNPSSCQSKFTAIGIHNVPHLDGSD